MVIEVANTEQCMEQPVNGKKSGVKYHYPAAFHRKLFKGFFAGLFFQTSVNATIHEVSVEEHPDIPVIR